MLECHRQAISESNRSGRIAWRIQPKPLKLRLRAREPLLGVDERHLQHSDQLHCGQGHGS
jgi:hypothetical protein